MIENYRNSLVGTVTFHPLEIKMMLKNRINRRTEKNKLKKGKTDKFLKILEDFVDDFIKIYQPQSEEHLLHLSQSLLHVIHTFFPPPSRKIYGSLDPISEGKLEKGEGLWGKREGSAKVDF